MKSFFIIIAISIINFSYSQEKKIKIISSNDLKPIENALIYESTINHYGYSNDLGIFMIKSTEPNDSIIIEIPGYVKYKTIISALDDIVELTPLYNILPEIVITEKGKMKSFESLTTNSKKSYFTNFISSGGSIVSTLYPEKYDNYKIESIQFSFDNSNLKPSDLNYIRPLLYLIEENNWLNLLDTPYSIKLNASSQNIIISLKNSTLKLNTNSTYLVGFELIQRNSSYQKISFSSVTKKGYFSFIRKKPDSKWFKVDNHKSGFSLDYKIYLSKSR